jgi:hypothetical protein
MSMNKQSTVRQAEIPAEFAAHSRLIAKLKALSPPRIVGKADADAVKARIDYLRLVQQAVNEFAETVIADTTDHIQGRIDYHKADEILLDAINEDSDWDVIAALIRAGCRFGRAASFAIAA